MQRQNILGIDTSFLISEFGKRRTASGLAQLVATLPFLFLFVLAYQ